MKIAVVHNLPRGGAKRVLDEQLKYLAKKHTIKTFKIDIKLHPNRLLRDIQNLYLLQAKHQVVAKKIDQEKVDVVLVHPDKLTQAPFILKYLKTPSVYFCEELLRIGYEKELKFSEPVGPLKYGYELLTRKLRKQIDKANAQRATTVVCASEYIRKKVKSVYGKSAYVCPLGVDDKTFDVSKNSKIEQLLFVGEPNYINGFDLAKDIAEQVNLPLKVISGWKLTDKQLAQHYSKSIVLCLSYNEPFGLVAIEGQLAGGIVLAVNDGGYKETIKHTKTGYLLPRKSEEFVKVIKQLLKKPALVKTIRTQARKRVLIDYNWHNHGVCLEKILKAHVKLEL